MIGFYEDNTLWNIPFKLSKSQNAKLKSELHKYAEELWLKKDSKVDELKVNDIVVKIATRSE